MAVQIRWQNGSHEWIPGMLYQGAEPYHDARGFMRYRDGFTIAHKGKNIDFACDAGLRLG